MTVGFVKFIVNNELLTHTHTHTHTHTERAKT
jgi:hypothetical protein